MTLGKEVFPVTEVGLTMVGGAGIRLIVARTTINMMKVMRQAQPINWTAQGVL